ncbi:MAG: PA14 domain-containing protein, partial [Anaerolineales bacterium]
MVHPPNCFREKPGSLVRFNTAHSLKKWSRLAICWFLFLFVVLMPAELVNAHSVYAPVEAPQPGLQGEYFDNTDLALPFVLSRMDATVDFLWVGGAPSPELPRDNFSVRWTGQVQAQYSETYSFHTFSDDGVRLWVDGKLLIDNWTVHGTTEDIGSVDLIAGQWYDIRLEYFELGGEARMSLEWSSDSTPQEVIPTSALRYPDTSKYGVSLSTMTQAADGGSPVSIAVEILDPANNPLVGLPIFVQVSGEFNSINGTDVLPGQWVPVGQTDSNGYAGASLTSTLAETKWVLVRVGDIVLLPAMEVEFTPGEPSSVQILLPGEEPYPGDDPGMIGDTDPIVVGQTANVRLRVVDSLWNLVESFNGEVALSTSDPAALLPSSVTITNGEATFSATWNTPGEHIFTVDTIADPDLDGGRPIEVLSSRVPGLQGRYFNN